MVQNKGVIFKQLPTGWPVEGKDLVVEVRDFDLDAEPPQDGITTKNYYAGIPTLLSIYSILINAHRPHSIPINAAACAAQK